MDTRATWHAVIFTPDQVSRLEHLKFEDEFDLLYKSAGSPRGMALFGLRSFTNHPMLYLSPGSSAHLEPIFRKYELIPCNIPPLEEILLLGGDPYSSEYLPMFNVPPPGDGGQWLPPMMP